MKLVLTVSSILAMVCFTEERHPLSKDFPFKGPVFPISFFNLDQDSAASDSAMQQFSFESTTESNWIWKKEETRSNKTDRKDVERTMENNYNGTISRNASQTDDEERKGEQVAFETDKLSLKVNGNSSNSKYSIPVGNNTNEDSADEEFIEDDSDDDYLPFLGEIDETNELGKNQELIMNLIE